MKNTIISILMIIALVLVFCLLVAIKQTFRHKTQDGYLVKFEYGKWQLKVYSSFGQAYWRYVVFNILDVFTFFE
ncbi:hypothetical protein [Lactobacillus ultunensis]|uniref:Uncharacterized protein n=1 Tax=Lactobacillus ultunensis DSM 16047 TaxID=525365 RepID=C2EPG5_9LACO|nr:hypothetical protein [Lactobacillus ultunensis]EEJ71541.1 hypothetical protein HMPREF0548_1561 [Lactobacillus ultunensis DSM 16047]QQP28359.1 hypothetical protein H4B44_09755 [Lactobacillus ultunensis]